MPDTFVTPQIALVPFKLLLWHWSSEGVSQIGLCMGILRVTAWDSRSFCLPQPQSPLVFTGKSYGDLPSSHWNPGLGGPVWGWDLSLLRHSSWFLPATHGCGTSPLVVWEGKLCLPTQTSVLSLVSEDGWPTKIPIYACGSRSLVARAAALALFPERSC